MQASRNFIVGLFVSIALITFVFTTIWLTGRSTTGRTISYSMFFEKGVSGLMLGGPVFYLGVEVGTVTAMTIVPGDPIKVRVDIKILESTPVDSGTWATLALQGITGVAVVKLRSDPGVHAKLHKHKGQHHLVIEVRDTGFSALMSQAPQIIDKLDVVLEQVRQLLGEENRTNLGNILRNFSAISGVLSSKQEAISHIPLEINASLQKLQATLTQIRTTTATLEPDINIVLDNLERITTNLDKMTRRMEQWAAGNDHDVNAFLEDGLGQMPALISDARATLREVEKLVRDLRANPSKLIYQPNEEGIDVAQ